MTDFLRRIKTVFDFTLMKIARYGTFCAANRRYVSKAFVRSLVEYHPCSCLTHSSIEQIYNSKKQQ